MINHVWSVLSKESKIEAETNSISIFDVLESIVINATPAPGEDPSKIEGFKFPIPFEVTTMLCKENSEKEERASLLIIQKDPDGEEISRIEQGIAMPIGMDFMRMRAKSKELAIKNKSGLYHFEVHLKDQDNDRYKIVSSIPFRITLSISEP